MPSNSPWYAKKATGKGGSKKGADKVNQTGNFKQYTCKGKQKEELLLALRTKQKVTGKRLPKVVGSKANRPNFREKFLP